METKDLILLMLIPILLISLVVFTDKSPFITGAVTAQQEKSNIRGTYSISPSFKAKIDYDLDEYKKIKEKLNQVLDECIEDDNIEECFQLKADEFAWNCAGKEEARILYDFVDKFNECLNQENGVVCRFSLDEREIENSIFNIKLTTEEQKIKAELTEGNKLVETAYINQENMNYVTDYNTKAVKSADIINIVVRYLAKKPTIIDASAEATKSPKIQLSKIFLVYKINKEVEFIDVLQENNFRDEKANKVIDLPKIKGFKFCAKSNKQVYAYDKIDNSVKLRDVIYKFSVTYPK